MFALGAIRSLALVHPRSPTMRSSAPNVGSLDLQQYAFVSYIKPPTGRDEYIVSAALALDGSSIVCATTNGLVVASPHDGAILSRHTYPRTTAASWVWIPELVVADDCTASYLVLNRYRYALERLYLLPHEPLIEIGGLSTSGCEERLSDVTMSHGVLLAPSRDWLTFHWASEAQDDAPGVSRPERVGAYACCVAAVDLLDDTLATRLAVAPEPSEVADPRGRYLVTSITTGKATVYSLVQLVYASWTPPRGQFKKATLFEPDGEVRAIAVDRSGSIVLIDDKSRIVLYRMFDRW